MSSSAPSSVRSVREPDHEKSKPSHSFMNDLLILRHLSILPGGFSAPDQLSHAVQHLLASSSNLKPPSQELNRILHSKSCHRKLLWSFVLGIQDPLADVAEDHAWEALEPHRDEGQVELDVARSFVFYPKNIPSEKKDLLRRLLKQSIIKALRRFPKLNYFQGYHDIVSIFLLNFIDFESLSLNQEHLMEGEAENIKLLDKTLQRFTLHRIRDSLTRDLSPTMGYLRLTQVILALEEPQLASLVAQTSNLPLFALSWILTLTSHDLTSFDTISRLFDFLFCHEPAMICYMASAICLTKTEEMYSLINTAALEGTEVDYDMVHFLMSKLPALTMNQQVDRQSTNPVGSAHEAKNFIQHDVHVGLNGAQEPMARSNQEVGPNHITQQSAKKSLNDNNQDFQTKQWHLQSHRKEGLSVEFVIDSALRLYKLYPPTDSRLKLSKIFGPKSCINTWASSESGDLTDKQAEDILAGPLILIIQPDRAELSLKRQQINMRRRRAWRRMIQGLIQNRQGLIFAVCVGLLAFAYSRKEQFTWLSTLTFNHRRLLETLGSVEWRKLYTRIF
ncbi:hypothetical protein O181_025568 [Austropuccinia psidii MF-1]|uniref:Rab-GAP TBC domain-containing protein n=1 Tax=Austropuccinia psidii MF-1 TaxID=1389203 RepID=A0A9Q3CKW7_9BASI|nr:hypothetical protein [Austropuccinia psidii MF-1]